MSSHHEDKMSIGFKKKVMVACVTFETVMITDPARSFSVDKIYLIHWVSPKIDNNNRSKEKADIYLEFYDRVKEMLIEYNPNIEIIERVKAVFNFSDMLQTVLSIIDTERDSDIFVNISAGSSEYTAAAVIASMMNSNVNPFSVVTGDFTVGNTEKIKEIYYDHETGKPIGLTSSVRDVKALPRYDMDKPKEYLVRGLRILNERSVSRSQTSAKYMVFALKKGGIWFRDTGQAQPDKPEQDQTEAVYYHRDYVQPWLNNGWAVKDDIIKNRINLTDDGKRIISTFYVDEP